MTRNKHIYKRLTFSDRQQIQTMIEGGSSLHEIHKELEIGKTTLRRERMRCKGGYNAEEAQLSAEHRKREKDLKMRGWRSDMVKRVENLESAIQILLSKPLD